MQRSLIIFSHIIIVKLGSIYVKPRQTRSQLSLG